MKIRDKQKDDWGSLRQDTRKRVWQEQRNLSNLCRCYECRKMYLAKASDKESCPSCGSVDTFTMGQVNYKHWTQWPNRRLK